MGSCAGGLGNRGFAFVFRCSDETYAALALPVIKRELRDRARAAAYDAVDRATQKLERELESAQGKVMALMLTEAPSKEPS